jgi:peroxiredoxin
VSWLAVGLVLPWVAVLVGCFFGYQILLQRRRIVLRLEGVEDDIYDELATGGPAELNMGAKATVFELPDLDGKPVSLRDFVGRRVLMIFVDPQCKFSRQLAPDLASMPLDGREGRPALLLISTGGVEANREFMKEFGLTCSVMLQEGWTSGGAYGIAGSPMGYMLDEEGHIASRLTMGRDDLAALAKAAVTGASPREQRGGRRRSSEKV